MSDKWDYRVVRKTTEKGISSAGDGEWLSIQEIYYDDETGEPSAQTIDLQVEGETITEMRKILERMINSLGQPIVDEIETSLKDDNYEGPQYLNRKWIYESPDGGKTIYRRKEGNYDRKKEKTEAL